MAQLRAEHNKSQTDASQAELRFQGLDLITGTVRDNMIAGVMEPAISKIKVQCCKGASQSVSRRNTNME